MNIASFWWMNFYREEICLQTNKTLRTLILFTEKSQEMKVYQENAKFAI